MSLGLCQSAQPYVELNLNGIKASLLTVAASVKMDRRAAKMNFSLEETIVDGIVHYRISGYVNEAAKFPPMKQSPIIRIDLGGTKGLNSLGTRNWCDWIAQSGSAGALVVEKCPVIFVKSFNNVVGACPKNMRVDSFYVPFIAPSDGARTDVLFLREQVSPDGRPLVSGVKNAQGEVLEIDVLDDYFRFLKK
jgi:hypothetical protein